MTKIKIMGWGSPIDVIPNGDTMPGSIPDIVNDDPLIILKDGETPKNCYFQGCEGISRTLAERGSRYGSFKEQGAIEQNIKRAFADSPNWSTLPDDSRSALEMIATKISRILKGDPEYHDSWHDIEGYAKLVSDRILKDAQD